MWEDNLTNKDIGEKWASKRQKILKIVAFNSKEIVFV